MLNFRIDDVVNENGTIERKIVQSSLLKHPPPFNITVRKNLAYNVFSRQFLHWVIEKSEKAKALLEWSQDTLTPDEHYWLMLDSLEEAPGRSGKLNWGSLTPYIVWDPKSNSCSGMVTQLNIWKTEKINISLSLFFALQQRP